MPGYVSLLDVSKVSVTISRNGKTRARFPAGKGRLERQNIGYRADYPSKLSIDVRWNEEYDGDRVRIVASLGGSIEWDDPSAPERCEINLSWEVFEEMVQRLGKARRGKQVLPKVV